MSPPNHTLSFLNSMDSPSYVIANFSSPGADLSKPLCWDKRDEVYRYCEGNKAVEIIAIVLYIGLALIFILAILNCLFIKDEEEIPREGEVVRSIIPVTMVPLDHPTNGDTELEQWVANQPIVVLRLPQSGRPLKFQVLGIQAVV